MKILMQLILEIISTLTTKTPIGFNAKGQPVKVKDIDSIKSWEELVLVAYLPTLNDRWTIGWGHTKTAHPGMVITEKQAEALLRSDLAWARKAVADLVDVPLSQEQYDALVSFVFNIGRTQFSKSTLLKKLNAADYEGAARQFPRWNKQKGRVLRGLTRRREYEMTKFLEGTKK